MRKFIKFSYDKWKLAYHISLVKETKFVICEICFNGWVIKETLSDELGKLALSPFVHAFLELLCSLTKWIRRFKQILSFQKYYNTTNTTSLHFPIALRSSTRFSPAVAIKVLLPSEIIYLNLFLLDKRDIYSSINVLTYFVQLSSFLSLGPYGSKVQKLLPAHNYLE